MSGSARPISLQRRLLLYLLVGAPLVWGLTLALSARSANEEVTELYDTQLVRVARELHSALDGVTTDVRRPAATAPPAPMAADVGTAELRDMALAAWDPQGQLLLVDREGLDLPRRPGFSGFVEIELAGQPWRVYYVTSTGEGWQVAAAHRLAERDELIWALVLDQLLPWLLMLPVLLLVMAWAVRRALAPVHGLADELRRRGADELRPLDAPAAPVELQPLLVSMNDLFNRIEAARLRERRFTADAAHELRTPLALLRAQWDLLRGAPDAVARRQAEVQLEAGIARMDRLVAQMLALSKVDAADRPSGALQVDWPALVEQVLNDVLPLAERRRIELGCSWPTEGAAPLPLQGDAGLLQVMLRNLLDNAVRYAPEGSAVELVLQPDALRVENDGAALAEAELAQLGQRFHRRDGQAESGSGLGVSIVQRVAALHGLVLHYGPRANGSGVVATLTRAG